MVVRCVFNLLLPVVVAVVAVVAAIAATSCNQSACLESEVNGVPFDLLPTADACPRQHEY